MIKHTKILNYLEIDENVLNEDFTQYIYIKEPLELVKILYTSIKELKEIGGNNEGINKLHDNYEELIKFMKNNQFMHFSYFRSIFFRKIISFE